MTSQKTEELKKIEVPMWMTKLLAHSHKKAYEAKMTIIHEGDTPKSLFFIIDGSVSVIIKDEHGHEIVLSYLNKGDFFGEMGLFDSVTQRSALVVAKKDCKLAEITYDQFKELAQSNFDIVFALASQIANRLIKTNEKVRDLAFLDVTGRIAHTLLSLCKEPDALSHPDGMQIKITRREISKIVGCSREMVGRVLKILEEQGLILIQGKTLVVLGARS